ncbi:hypothetical protein EON65_56385 [archaeon]|nr:MAG: hypothetical protein EON65_56385 [archaeon]
MLLYRLIHHHHHHHLHLIRSQRIGFHPKRDVKGGRSPRCSKNVKLAQRCRTNLYAFCTLDAPPDGDPGRDTTHNDDKIVSSGGGVVIS